MKLVVVPCSAKDPDGSGFGGNQIELSAVSVNRSDLRNTVNDLKWDASNANYGVHVDRMTTTEIHYGRLEDNTSKKYTSQTYEK
jgi:hypothetical protein